jgi:glycosyltransferase involved in cell wall biosynthesis
MKSRRIVVISDFQDGHWGDGALPTIEAFRSQWINGRRGSPPSRLLDIDGIEVVGGYLERLPLAAMKAGIVDYAEIWTHWQGSDPPSEWTDKTPSLLRRAFRMDGPKAPFASRDMLGHIQAFGPPDILCVWGLGVSEEIMLACRDSFTIYNSIDAPAFRVPVEVSRHFDLVITGAQWQSEVVRSRHPDMRTIVMPIGPEFASELTFHQLLLPKIYDLIYVAAAQAYKRHDILFDALAKLPRSLRALCVFGHGELVHELRSHADQLGINVDFVGPPGVAFEEVNRLMNQSRIGVVCGIDDGAPAILTEYMLAGIPVLANSALRCGLQYITPETGRTAAADDFHDGIWDLLERADTLRPREVVLANWSWPHSIRRLRQLIDRP